MSADLFIDVSVFIHHLDKSDRRKHLLAAGCSKLATEDLQHGQRIDGLTIFNPFQP